MSEERVVIYTDGACSGNPGPGGVYDHFDVEGIYQVAIYAMDRVGNTSVPELVTRAVPPSGEKATSATSAK